MGFYQGLAGLNSINKALDVTGHNLANALTVGYKSQSTNFADIYAGALGDNQLSRNQIGNGVYVQATPTNYKQGSITSTGGELDMAINGAGFFRMQTPEGSIYYTRNGLFHLDKDGYIRNDGNLMVTGYPGNENGTITSGYPQPLRVDSPTMDPVETSFASLGANLDSRAKAPSVDFTLPNGTSLPSADSYNIGTSQIIYDSLGNSHTLDYYFRKTGPNQWSMFTVVDKGANSNVKLNISGAESNYLNLQQFEANNETLQDFLSKYPDVSEAIRNIWPPADATTAGNAVTDFNNAYADLIANTPGYTDMGEKYATGADFLAAFPEMEEYLNTLADFNPENTRAQEMRDGISTLRNSAVDITFDSQGHVVKPASPNAINFAISGFNTTTGGVGPGEVPDPTNPGTLMNLGELNMTLDVSSMTQFGQTSAFNKNHSNGNAPGEFAGIDVSDEGIISAKYSNQEVRVLGQLALATFPSTYGLARIGDNLFAETSKSGEAVIATPGAGRNGTIAAQSREESNVDMATELVQMTIQQRMFQANSQTITTQDAILQTLISMR